MKYVITGVAPDGSDKSMIIEAEAERDAISKAKSAGIAPYHIDKHRPPPPKEPQQVSRPVPKKVTYNSRLNQCRACRRDVAKEARKCPHCGASNEYQVPNNIAAIIIGSAALFFIIVLFGGSSREPKTGSELREQNYRITQTANELIEEWEKRIARLQAENMYHLQSGNLKRYEENQQKIRDLRSKIFKYRDY